jgi:hypothetical protein
VSGSAGRLLGGIRWRATGLLAFAGALSACAALALPAVTDAVPTGAIEGTITKAEGGEPIANAEVCAKRTQAEFLGECAFTHENGQYTIPNLRAGEYRVRFSGDIGPVHKVYATKWYNDAPSFAKALPLKVEAGKVQSGVNASLAIGAHVSGRVTDGEGHPLQVVVFVEEEVEAGVYEPIEFFVADAEGMYTISGIGEHPAYVDFSGYTCGEAGCPTLYARQYYNDKPSLASATPLMLKPGESLEGVNAVMIENGHISGRVTSAALEHEPLEGTRVCAHAQSGELAGSSFCTRANANGEYTITALPTGSYSVQFTGEICKHGECIPEYLSQYYSGKASAGEATPVAANVATTTRGIDAELFELAPSAPSNTALPTLAGGFALGGTLTCAPGTWANKPTKLEYAWLRNAVPIAAQTSNRYTVQVADEGQSLSCRVTASNGAGSVSASTASVGVPLVRGKAAAGRRAVVHDGRAAVTLHCTGPGACSGTLTLTARLTRARSGRHGKRVSRGVRHVVIGTASFSIAAGASETVEVRLSARGRALLRRAGSAGLGVELSGSGLRSSALVLETAARAKGRAHHQRR